jgi:hypothetical protein
MMGQIEGIAWFRFGIVVPARNKHTLVGRGVGTGRAMGNAINECNPEGHACCDLLEYNLL